jgi:hypothetical protein
MSTGARVTTQEACSLSRTHQSFKRGGVGTNGIFESNILSKNEHRTRDSPVDPGSNVARCVFSVVTTIYGGNGKRWWTPEMNSIGHAPARVKRINGVKNSTASSTVKFYRTRAPYNGRKRRHHYQQENNKIQPRTKPPRSKDKG